MRPTGLHTRSVAIGALLALIMAGAVATLYLDQRIADCNARTLATSAWAAQNGASPPASALPNCNPDREARAGTIAIAITGILLSSILSVLSLKRVGPS